MKNVMHHPGNEFSLFVGDLPHDCSDDTLQRLFQQKFKSVKRVQIIRNEDGSSRGFGFIRFEDRNELRAALGQNMKIGNTSLRIDMAKETRTHKNNRSRYNSFNSTGNNYNNNNNNHHHHQQQHYSHTNGPNHNHHRNHFDDDNWSGRVILKNSQLGGDASNSTSQNKSIQQSKQPSELGGDANNSSSPNKSTQPSQQMSSQEKSQSQQAPSTGPVPQLPTSATNVPTTTSTGASHPNSNTTTSVSSSIPSGSQNLTLNQGQPLLHQGLHQAIGPDMRGFPTGATMMDTHLLNSDQPSAMIPPTSVYGHMYSYGPQFGYLPTPQPNPVAPISRVPPVAPNQAPPSAAINHHIHQSHHHPAQHSHLSAQNSAIRYNTSHHHPNQPHHHSHPHAHHQQQQPSATTGASADATGLNTNPGGVQTTHQGPPLYYYYPSPLYFDQGVAAPAHPNIYHTQPFHPQFFAMPSPAYMPSAHTPYNQPPVSQSEVTPIMVDQPQQQQAQEHQQQHPQQTPQQQSQQQPQVMRTRDIDTTIE